MRHSFWDVVNMRQFSKLLDFQILDFKIKTGKHFSICI